MKLQNRLKSYTVVLLLSPLLFLGSLNGETGRKSVKELFIVQKILEKMEEYCRRRYNNFVSALEPSLFEKTELGDFQAINDPKTTLSELEKSAQERIYLKLVEEIERITSSCN